MYIVYLDNYGGIEQWAVGIEQWVVEQWVVEQWAVEQWAVEQLMSSYILILVRGALLKIMEYYLHNVGMEHVPNMFMPFPSEKHPDLDWSILTI